MGDLQQLSWYFAEVYMALGKQRGGRVPRRPLKFSINGFDQSWAEPYVYRLVDMDGVMTMIVMH